MSVEEEILFEMPHHAQFKVVIVGQPMVGKTFLVSRFTSREFEHMPTAGADISYFKLKKKESEKEITSIFWDLSGQPTFKKVRPVFFKGAHAVIIVFDLSRKDTAIAIPEWVKEAHRVVPDRPLILIGNKNDLEFPEVSKEDALKFAEKLNAPYYECSALKNVNVHTAFAEAIRKAVNYRNTHE